MNSHSQDHRTNEDWVRELRGDLGAEKQAEAYLDLGCLLDRVVRPYLRKIAGSYQQDDLVFSIVQDTLRKIYQKKLYDSYAGKAKFTSYICAIATHQAISEMRKKQWKMERTLESLPEEQSDAKEEIRTLAPKYLIDLTSLDPETQLELNDFAQRLDK